jgi:hypothetical protein
MNKMVALGDPDFTIELEYGEKWVMWRQEGVLCSFTVKISQLLKCAQTNTCVIYPPAAVPVKEAIPQDVIQDFLKSPFAKMSNVSLILQ